MSVSVWSKWYEDEGATDSRSEGLLPFRVWQIFDEMVRQLKARDDTKFLCAAGVLAHYVGDACQPLHGSYHSDGYRDAPGATAKKWPGKGVHSTYEDKMVDRHSSDLLPQILPQAKAFTGEIPSISAGRDAAFATVKLMSEAAEILPPSTLIDKYIKLGGGSSAKVVDALWEAFGNDTAKLMGAGARYLAAMWEAAFAKSGYFTGRRRTRNIGSGTGEGLSGQRLHALGDLGQGGCSTLSDVVEASPGSLVAETAFTHKGRRITAR